MTVDDQPQARDRFEPHGAPFDLAPPGERYFRHPGDVVRLVLWATITASCSSLIIEIGPRTTSDGVAADLGRVAARAPAVSSASCCSRSPRSSSW